MRTRTFLLAGLVLVVAVLLVWFPLGGRSVRQPPPAKIEQPRNISANLEPRPAAAAVALSSAKAKAWSLLNLAGLVRENIPAKAGPVLEQAIASASFCETQRRQLAGSSNVWAISTAEAYARKVFKDDFALAANLAPDAVDCSQADAVFAAANEKMNAMSDAELAEVASAASQQPPRETSSQTIADFYQRLLTAHDDLGPAYSNVLQTTKALVPGLDPTASDLFKDAAVYVGELSVMQRFQAKIGKLNLNMGKVPDNVPKSTLDAMRSHFEEANKQDAAKFKTARDAMDAMVNFRLREVFGIANSAEVLSALQKLSLPEGAGLIDIPCPD